METINYFKIKYMIESIVVDELKDNLSTKLYTDITNPINILSVKKYESLYKQNDIADSYDNLTKAEKSLLELGLVEKFSFKLISNLILKIKVLDILQDEYDTILNFVNFINLNFNTIKDFKINEIKFKEIKNEILDFLDEITIGGIKKKEIEKKLNSNSTDDFWFMPENKERVDKFKEIGNKFYLKGEFDKAIKNYLEAIKIVGISDSIQGILYLNISTCYLGKLNSKNRAIKYMETEYPLPIHEALRFSILSLSKRPNWFKPYYRISQIFSKFSKFEKSLQFLNSSISIGNNDSTASIDELNKFKIQINEKLKLIQDCLDSAGKRDFEKESLLKIEKFGMVHLNQFKEKLTDKFIKLIKKNTVKSFEKYIDDTKSFNDGQQLSEKHLIERFIADVVRLQSFPDLDLQAEAYSRCIGNQCKYAQPYFEFANSLIPPNPKDMEIRNYELIIGLMLYASSLPINFEITLNSNSSSNSNDDDQHIQDSFNIHKINGGVIRAQEFLGCVYRQGLYGEDIDLEKSIYYFNKSMENSKDIKIKYLHIFGYECIAPLTLSDMYLHGDTPTGSNDIEKSKQLYQHFNDTKYKLMQLKDKYEGPPEGLGAVINDLPNGKKDIQLVENKKEKESDILYDKYLW